MASEGCNSFWKSAAGLIVLFTDAASWRQGLCDSVVLAVLSKPSPQGENAGGLGQQRLAAQRDTFAKLTCKALELENSSSVTSPCRRALRPKNLDDSVSLRVGETRSAWKTQAAVEELFRDGVTAPYPSS